VDAAWRRILDRAGERPAVPLTDDPDLHLLVDGDRIDPIFRTGAARTFSLAARPRSVRIVSRSASPLELGLARDPRVLGVAIGGIVLRKGRRSRSMVMEDPALTDGFHGYEPDLAHRWTDGHAELPASLFAGFDGPMVLTLNLSGAARYPAFIEAAASRAAA
jgi:hypothetical protein